tara:strand:- start:48 stop:290 length:243 start_codon:yes stop_codon:yes gene_type:complete
MKKVELGGVVRQLAKEWVVVNGSDGQYGGILSSGDECGVLLSPGLKAEGRTDPSRLDYDSEVAREGVYVERDEIDGIELM